VLYQQEKAVNGFSDVPEAVIFVSEQFTGKSASVTTSLLSAIVLANVGLFKVIIFLLPINKLKQASQASEKRFAELDDMRRQIDRENDSRLRPKGLDWASDFQCPVVRVRVYEDASSGQFVASTGSLNVPIMESTPIEATLAVPLHGGRAQRAWGARAEVEIVLTWSPSGQAGLPCGDLELAITGGSNFAGSSTCHWRVHIEAPETLYGARASAGWQSPASLCGGPRPEWGGDAKHTFKVQWERQETPQAHRETDEERFRKQVLELLRQQASQISELQEQVSKLKR